MLLHNYYDPKVIPDFSDMKVKKRDPPKSKLVLSFQPEPVTIQPENLIAPTPKSRPSLSFQPKPVTIEENPPVALKTGKSTLSPQLGPTSAPVPAVEKPAQKRKSILRQPRAAINNGR